jgi:hypothetical protein
MTAGTLIELQANLKALNLSSMARNLEGLLRQAKESGIGYDELLLDLTGQGGKPAESPHQRIEISPSQAHRNL